MKIITINIIELKDICRFFTGIFDKIMFCFSKPKYKIGNNINMSNWGKDLKIIHIYRNWDYCAWSYSTDKNTVDFSEDLINFYN